MSPGASEIPLRWFSADDVLAAMPPVDERLRLAELTMIALARPGSSELPPKIGIHPRPHGSFVHAMPAHLRAASPDGDLVGMKWVAGFPTNNALGVASVNAIVVLNDPGTGVPTAILDGGPITAHRTAAVSGLALARFGPAARDGLSVAFIGAGVQGHSHLPVIARVLPGAHLRLHDRHPERARALAEVALAEPGIAAAEVTPTDREAIADADVVVTAASFAPPGKGQVMTSDWLAPQATVVPIDYATYCSAEVARGAALFLVDDRGQFFANREAGNFDGYPDPSATIGEAILAGTPRPPGRVVVNHLGVGLADLVLADAVVRAAIARGLGTALSR